MRKFGFTALVSFLFLLASCMNMGGSSGEDGAIRVALPGSGSRGAYTLSKENAKTYKVALLLDGVAILAPLGIFAMGLQNYLRSGQVTNLGFVEMLEDALFKQGVTFTVLGRAYLVNDQVQDLGFKFFTMGAFISNITEGFIGQTFLGCEALGSTNSAKLALEGNSYSHTMSYLNS